MAFPWLLVIVAVFACEPAIFEGCGDTVAVDLPSPDGLYVATVYERDCGATADFSTHVSLRDSGPSFDGESQTSILILEGRHVVELEWRPDGAISVVAPTEGAFAKLQRWRDVDIIYE